MSDNPSTGAGAGGRKPSAVMDYDSGYQDGFREAADYWREKFNEAEARCRELEERLKTETLAHYSAVARCAALERKLS